MSDLKAFRCINCGHLVPSSHAGERSHPYACPVCKRGIAYGTTIAALRKDNPALFANLSDAEIKVRSTEAQVAPGVSFCHFAVHENWQILADLTPDQLTAIDHALKPEHVERHVPCAKGASGTPQVIERTAVDGVATQDKA